MPEIEDIVVPIQSGGAALILEELGNTAPSGGTPTAAALTRALEYFTTGEGASLAGEKYVLLATDGGPNCNEDLTCAAATCTLNIEDKCPPNTNCCDAAVDPVGPTKCLDEDASVAAVAALAAEGIKTFVVGIPGTEAYADTLDLLAAESGVANPGAPPDYFAVPADGGGLKQGCGSGFMADQGGPGPGMRPGRLGCPGHGQPSRSGCWSMASTSTRWRRSPSWCDTSKAVCPSIPSSGRVTR